jgi:hypothetical protein
MRRRLRAAVVRLALGAAAPFKRPPGPMRAAAPDPGESNAAQPATRRSQLADTQQQQARQAPVYAVWYACRTFGSNAPWQGQVCGEPGQLGRRRRCTTLVTDI